MESTTASVLRPGTLVVLESTTYPGTTREVLRPDVRAHLAALPRTVRRWQSAFMLTSGAVAFSLYLTYLSIFVIGAALAALAGVRAYLTVFSIGVAGALVIAGGTTAALVTP